MANLAHPHNASAWSRVNPVDELRFLISLHHHINLQSSNTTDRYLLLLPTSVRLLALIELFPTRLKDPVSEWSTVSGDLRYRGAA